MKKKLRILLIDDDEDDFVLTRQLLAGLALRATGLHEYQIALEWVSDYTAALEALRKQEHDVYLVDYRLGKKDGLALLREAAIRENPAPVIFMTGQGNYAVDLKAMQIGASDYMPKKELTTPSLERSIRYALERKRTEMEIRRYGAQQQLLAALSQDFTEAGLDYQSVLDTITRRVAEATGDAVMIMIAKDAQDAQDAEDEEKLSPATLQDSTPPVMAAWQGSPLTSIFSITKQLASQVFESGQPVWIEDLAKPAAGDAASPVEDARPGDLPFGSLFIAPLRVQRRSIGTISLLRPMARAAHSPDERTFLLDLANRAAMAIENASLYAREAERAHELAALQTATSQLLTTLQLDELIEHVLYALQGAIPAAERGCLYMLNTETGNQEVRARFGAALSDGDVAALAMEQALVTSATRERRPMIISDQDVPLVEVGEPGHPFQSVVITPLATLTQHLGVILLASSQAESFTPADLRLLVSFANTTTGAIQNARLHAEMQKLAITDGLTNFLNRRGLFQLGAREFDRAHRFARPLSAILIDLDLFKDVNDTYGHATGDAVLRILADRIAGSVRELDIIGRYGGDEFVILLPESEIDAALAVASRVHNRIVEPIHINLREGTTIQISVTASLGISQAGANTEDFMTLISQADEAAYRAKRAGGNRISANSIDENGDLSTIA